MFDATIEDIEPNRVTRYRLLRDAESLEFSEVLDLWKSDRGFRSFFTNLLAESPFAGFRLETPALTIGNATQPFQFVLLNSPGFSSRETDSTTYASHFTTDDTDNGVVAFDNLSGDATLVVPSPRTIVSAYGHLAAFVRYAPEDQIDALWRIVGDTAKSAICHRPLWISTAGGGVAWLHVRVDSRPKYYGHSPYKTA